MSLYWDGRQTQYEDYKTKLESVSVSCKGRCFKTANIKNCIRKFNAQMLAITVISAVFGRPFVRRFAICYRSVVLSVCLSVTFVHCGQTVRRIKVKLGMQVGLGAGHIALDGDPAPPPPKGAQPPIFVARIRCGQMAAGIKMPLGMEVGLGPVDFVLDGDPAPLLKKGAEPLPQFSAHFYCGQTVGYIKMPLGIEVGLIPGDFVFDGDPTPPLKGGGAPNFRPMCIAAKRQDTSRCHLAWR